MKKIINVVFISIIILVLALFGIRYYTKSHSPFENIEAKAGDLKVNVGYGRPFMKNRKIFGELVPYNTIWRTGANEATVINISRRCTIGGKKIVAGTYSLWTIPGENYWTIILNNETGQWGTNYDETKDQLRFKIKADVLANPVEQLTIGLNPVDQGIDMGISWEKTFINIPIR
jgi:hypothetical protein